MPTVLRLVHDRCLGVLGIVELSLFDEDFVLYEELTAAPREALRARCSYACWVPSERESLEIRQRQPIENRSNDRRMKPEQRQLIGVRIQLPSADDSSEYFRRNMLPA